MPVVRKSAVWAASTIVTLLSISLAVPAMAQAPDPQAPPPSAPVPAQPVDAAASPAPQVVSPTVPTDDLAARLDEIDQLARIAARKHEILEEQAEKRAKEAPKLSIDDKGFAITLPDKSFALRIRGLVQGDGRFFLDNDALAANDTFLVRKFRPSLEGTLFSIVDFRLLPEFAGTVQVLDGYVDLHPWNWLRLRVGKYKAPIGLERLQGDPDRAFLEQTLVQNLSSQRDVGLQLWGDVAGGIVHYVIGAFNGAPDGTGADTDLNHAKDFQGRLFFHPLRTEALGNYGNLGIGVSAGTGHRKGRLPTSTAAAATGLSPFRTAGQNTFFSYLAPATDTTGATTTFTNQRSTRVNPQLYYYQRWFGLLAEYLWLKQGVQKGNTTTVLTHQAAAATLSVTLGGTEGYDGATPDHVFDTKKGHWGALQIAARWNWLKADNDTFPVYANPVASARSAQGFGGAVTWVPRRSLHYTVSFEQTRFKGGGGTAATATAPANVTDRLTENVVIGRAQLNF